MIGLRAIGLGLAIVAAAPLPAAAAARETALVNQLVLTSAVMRQAFEQRAAQDQFAAFQRLSIAESKLGAALRDAKASRAQQVELRRQLGEIDAQRQALVSQLDAKDEEFARRYAALRAEIERVVARASPEKLALLQRFADGDRSVAYDRIVEISYAENAARQKAAAIASVENLRPVLTLTQEMLARGERTLLDVTRVAQDMAALEPENVESAERLIGLLGAQRRFAEANAIADRTRPLITDSWSRLAFEVDALPSRTALFAERRARQFMLEADTALLKEHSFASMAQDDQRRYCGFVVDLVDAAPSALYEATTRSTFVACMDIVGGSNDFSMKLPTMLSKFFEFVISNRNIDTAEKAHGFYDKNIARFPGLPKIKALYDTLRMTSLSQSLSLRMAEAGSIYSTTDPKVNLADQLVAIWNELLPLVAGKDGEDYDELKMVKAVLLALNDDYARSRTEFEDVLKKDPGPLPARLGADENPWLLRNKALQGLGAVCVQLNDLACSDAAMVQLADSLRSLQRLHPLDSGDLFTETHPTVYADLMEAALLRAQIRAAHRRYDEADRTLMAVVARLEPFMDGTVYGPSWPPFQAKALVQSGIFRGLQGKTQDARGQLVKARDLALARLKTEPRFFLWTAISLNCRLKIAQLDRNRSEIAAARAEIEALRKAGKGIDARMMGKSDEVKDWELGAVDPMN